MSTALDKVNGHAVTAEPRFDPVALAEAAAIRSRSEAETEARLTLARAEAKAIEAKAEQEAERLRIINDRADMKLKEQQAEHAKKMAAEQAERAEIGRREAEAAAKDEAERHAEAMAAEEVAAADEKWRKYAIRFAVVCGIVALPVQIAAFWNPESWWLVAAPVMLEGGSWVVQRGAAAAVANRRPLWHYRSIAWLLAFVAAGINLWHGLAAFDPATAGATAFASLAGPGVWDLHEHGRIRKRDGVLSRRERKAQERMEKRAAAEKAAAEKVEAERQAYREKAAREAAEELDQRRAEEFPKVHRHAKRLAADLGETTVTEAIWKRAKRDIEGTDPGESVDIIRGRNMAARRVEAARSEAPGSTPSKVTNAQRVPHLPPAAGRGSRTGPKVRGIRRKGDTPKYVEAARKQAAITARNAVSEEQK